MGLGSNRVRNGAVGVCLVLDLEDCFGCVRGGGDDSGDEAKAEGRRDMRGL